MKARRWSEPQEDLFSVDPSGYLPLTLSSMQWPDGNGFPINNSSWILVRTLYRTLVDRSAHARLRDRARDRVSWTIVGLPFFMVREQRRRGSVTIRMRSSVGAGSDQPVLADTLAQRAALVSEVLRLDAWCAAACQAATIH